MKSSGHPHRRNAAATNRRALAALGATEGKTVESSSVDFSLLPPPRRARLVSAVMRRHRSVERDEAVQRAGLHRLQHRLLGNPGALCDLARRRRAPLLLAERRDDAAQLEVELLHTTRHTDRPSAVPEVPLQLAEDRRGGERGELESPIGVETFDRLEQAHQRNLHEVVARLAPIRKAAREEVRERGVLLDELVANAPVAGAAVEAESLVDGLVAPVG